MRIQEESRTMATITFQNLFRIYKKLAGMTGTAETEAQEFHATYKLDVTAIPTNREAVRQDEEDLVYKTEREKFTAVVKDILEKQEQGRPVLVGTTSVEKSSAISRILTKKKVAHAVLNAKHHENEAYVVAQAGRKGAITVSTNMAGRGTDIILGGNPEMLARLEFKEANRSQAAEPEAFAEVVKKYEASCRVEHDEVIGIGGLHIVGTERHESRRIDNQLRGRAGRQGDPGSSKFYLSLEDDLMRIFARRAREGPDGAHGHARRRAHRASVGHPQRRERAAQGRGAQLRHSQESARVRRRDERAAEDGVLAPPTAPGRPLHAGGDRRARQADGAAPCEIPMSPDPRESVAPLVAQLFGMFAEQPVTPRDEVGRGHARRRATSSPRSRSVVEVETLEREVYSLWGVRIDAEIDRKKKPIELYDDFEKLVASGLSEQRERVLDLIDRVMSAMIEESCPKNRPPEDWDWQGIHDGFKEHIKRPLGKEVDELGEVERLARVVFDLGEEAFLEKEKEVGVENLLRLFRHYYLEEIDHEWVDHLTNMEHLRDGIGLRGYGQTDPKNEYKKEGYNLFLNMMANVSSNVLVKLFELKGAQRPDDIAALQAEAEARHHHELEAAIARHPGDEDT